MLVESNSSSEVVRVAQIVGAQGIKGEVKLDLLTDFVERLDKGRRVLVDGAWAQIVSSRWMGDRLIIGLDTIKNRNAAEAAQWQFVDAPGGKPELDEDEFMVDDLIGLMVVTTEGKELGKVDEVLPYPAHDTLVIGEVMIPMVKEFIKDVDLDKKAITVRLIPGMLGEEDSEDL